MTTGLDKQPPAEKVNLADPIALGPMQVKNRLFLPPHGTNYTEVAGNQRLADYYGERARGGVGLIVHEAVPVHPSGARLSGKVHGWKDESVAGFALVADAVRAEGTKVVVQIYHVGRQMTPGKGMRAAWGPSAKPCPETRSPVHPMTSDDIESVVAGFATTARHVAEGGLDGVEVHGAHGYLLTAFMSPISNFRTDEYGGSFENRMRFPLQVFEAIERAVPAETAIGVRISAEEMVEGGLDLDDTREILDYLRRRVRIDYVSISAGNYQSHENVVPDHSFPPRVNAARAKLIRETISPIPVLLAGRIRDSKDCESVLESGSADMIGAVRAQIADPRWAQAMLAGSASSVGGHQPRPCIYCNDDCRGNLGRGLPIACAVNPYVGVPSLPVRIPVRSARGVVVVGGGPAGLTAAARARECGLEVALFESRYEVGGQLRIAVEAKGRVELGDYLRYLKTGLATSRVDLHLGTELMPGDPLPFDDVIVAVGARQAVPAWVPAGIAGGVTPIASWDALSDTAELGAHVVVVDDGADGWAMASTVEELRRRGAKVTLVTEGAYAGYRLPMLSIRPFTARLERADIDVVPYRTVSHVEPGALRLRSVTTDKDRETLAFDTLVYTGGHVPDESRLAPWLAPEIAHRVHVVGDAYAARGLGEANREAAFAVDGIAERLAQKVRRS